jgi:hypothetical protein
MWKTVIDGFKTDQIWQFEIHHLQKFNASSIGPLLVRRPSGS